MFFSFSLFRAVQRFDLQQQQGHQWLDRHGGMGRSDGARRAVGHNRWILWLQTVCCRNVLSMATELLAIWSPTICVIETNHVLDN